MSDFSSGDKTTKGSTIAAGDASTSHQFTGSVFIEGSLSASAEVSASAFFGDGGGLTNLPGGGGGGGISWDGSTANGVATYKDGDEATVESKFTYDGDGEMLSLTGTLNHTGSHYLSGTLTITGVESTPMLVMDDSDASAQIGRAHVGYVGSSDYAAFAHQDNANTSNYCISQRSTGQTDINTRAGTNMTFRYASAVRMQLDQNGGVAIGANYAPAAYKFDVSGSARLGTDLGGDGYSADKLFITGAIIQTGSTSEFHIPGGRDGAWVISGSGDTGQGDPANGLYFGVNTAIKNVRLPAGAIIDLNKKLWFGTGSLLSDQESGVGDTSIHYAAGQAQLVISGSDNGVQIEGSISAPNLASGTLAGADSYVGISNSNQLVIVTASAGGGGGTAAGSDTQIQFNDGGSSFGGAPNLTYDKTQSRFFVSGSTLLTGSVRISGSAAVGVAPNYDGQGANGVVFRIEGGAVHQDNGKSALICQITGTNSGDAARIGVATTSPKVALDVRWSPDLDNNAGGGDVVTFGNDTGLLSGAIYYLDSSGQWMSASAHATGSGNNSLLAIALGASAQGSESDAGGMLIRGWVNTTRFNGDFIPGGAVYIESGSGGGFMSGAAPTATDSYARIVGYAGTDPNLIYFNPGTNWVELS